MTTSDSGGINSNLSNQQAVGGINQGVDPFAPDPLADMPTLQAAATGTDPKGKSSSGGGTDGVEDTSTNPYDTGSIYYDPSVFQKDADKEQIAKGNPNAVSTTSPTATSDAIEQQGKAHRRRMRRSIGGVG